MHPSTPSQNTSNPALLRLGIVLFFSLLLLTPSVFADNTSDLDYPLDPQYDLPLDELRSFAEVYERIKQAYVHEVDDRELLESAIKGMLSGLDPHSAYLAPEAFKDLRESTQGEFGGLGIEIGIEEGYIKVISPIDDTPASRAGLQPHDLIIRINDTPTREMSVDKAMEIMRGEPGTKIELTIQREEVNQPFKVTLERGLIRITSVKEKMLETGFGYLRISQFQNRSGNEVQKALNRLVKENQAPLEGLILDLRNNPGGVLQAAADVVDVFLDKGLIVYTRGRLPDTQMRFEANPGDSLDGAPLVVLINGGSASASEIVAGALQDHQRALIMGTASFGKGSVQTILPLNNDRAIKMTTALYYTPNGRSIQAEGIQPDIEVVNARITLLETNQTTKEADLDGHLNNESKGLKGKKAAASLNTAEDYPLNEALNLLRGLVIFKSRHLPVN
ncbi:MAG: S41 family peptidase [Pseudomonadaceae bacterium]|nr:S41 family peptidase [Pseudomonadaceae bacterium]